MSRELFYILWQSFWGLYGVCLVIIFGLMIRATRVNPSLTSLNSPVMHPCGLLYGLVLLIYTIDFCGALKIYPSWALSVRDEILCQLAIICAMKWAPSLIVHYSQTHHFPLKMDVLNKFPKVYIVFGVLIAIGSYTACAVLDKKWPRAFILGYQSLTPLTCSYTAYLTIKSMKSVESVISGSIVSEKFKKAYRKLRIIGISNGLVFLAVLRNAFGFYVSNDPFSTSLLLTPETTETNMEYIPLAIIPVAILSASWVPLRLSSEMTNVPVSSAPVSNNTDLSFHNGP